MVGKEDEFQKENQLHEDNCLHAGSYGSYEERLFP